jgi:predicted site-specific integrase-resolvase
MTPMTQRLLTPQDVSLLLTIPTRRVIRLVRRGLIPHIVMPDGELLFDSSDLESWIESRRIVGNNAK